MKSLFRAALLSLLSPLCVPAADPPSLEWSREFGNEAEHSITLVAQLVTADDSVIHVGSVTETTGLKLTTPQVWKHSATGELEWQRNLGVIEPDLSTFARAAAIDSAGAVYIYSAPASPYPNGGSLQKLDVSGNPAWSIRAGSENGMESVQMTVDSTGAVYLSTVRRLSNLAFRMHLEKLNAAGERQWEKGPLSRPVAIAPLPGGGVAISSLREMEAGPTPLSISRFTITDIYNAQGSLRGESQRCCGNQFLEERKDIPSAVAVDTAGNVFVAGTAGNAAEAVPDPVRVAVMRTDVSSQSSDPAVMRIPFSSGMAGAVNIRPECRGIALDGTGLIGVISFVRFSVPGAAPDGETQEWAADVVTALDYDGAVKWSWQSLSNITGYLNLEALGKPAVIRGLHGGGFLVGGAWGTRAARPGNGARSLGYFDTAGVMKWFWENSSLEPGVMESIDFADIDSTGRLIYASSWRSAAVSKVIIEKRGLATGAEQQSVTARPADQITWNSARLNGIAVPSSTWHFIYGRTTDYGLRSPDTGTGAASAPVPVNWTATGLEPGVLYHFRVVADSATGRSVSDDITFMTARSPFQTWIEEKTGSYTAPGSGPADDPDKDGCRNDLEFAFNGEPLAAGSLPGLPAGQPYKDVQAGKTYLAITWNENPDASDLRYVVEASRNLIDWSEAGSGPDSIVIQHPLPYRTRAIATGGQKYMRVRIVPVR